MTSPTLGAVSFEISPDVNLTRFRTQGAAAAAAFGRSFDGATRTALSGLGALAGVATTAGLGIGKGLGLASKELLALEHNISSVSFQLRALGGTLTTFVTGPLVAAGVGLSAWGLTTAMKIEDAMVALKALLPPGYDVEALFGRLSDLAVKSPVFSIDAVSTFTKTLVGAGVQIDLTESILKSLDKTFTVFGVTGDRAELVLRAIGQVFSKGKVSAEELTQQIGEQIPIWGLLAQAAGMTIPELQAMQAEGDFTVAMFGDLLSQIGALPAIAAGAASGVDTLSARLSIMKESIQQALAVGFLDIFPEIKAQLDRLQPVLVEFTTFLVHQIPLLVDLFGRLVDEFFQLRQQFDSLNPAMQKLVLRIALLAPVVGPALLVIGTLGTAISSLLAVVAFAINPVTLFFAALIYGIQNLWRTSADFRDNVVGFQKAFVSAFMEELPAAMQAFKDSVLNDIIPALTKLAKALSFTSWEKFGAWLGHTLPKLIVGAVKSIAVVITTVADVVTYLRAQWDGLSESTQKLILRVALLALAFAPLLPLVVALAPVVLGVTLALSALTNLILGLTLGVLKLFISLVGVTISILVSLASAIGVVGFAMIAIVGAIGYGLYEAWQRSETFRNSVAAFANGFRDAWGDKMPAALDRLVSAVTDSFLPAVLHLAAAFGLDTWEKFSYWLGTVLPRILAFAIDNMAHAIELISRAIDFFAEKWAALDDTTQQNIKTMLKWAAATAGVILLAEGLAAAILGVLGPWELLLVALVAGTKYLSDSSAKFRGLIDAFKAGFSSGWADTVPGALSRLAATVQQELIPALLRLVGLFGINSWEQFASWLGSRIPAALGFFIDKLTKAVDVASNVIDFLVGKWLSLDSATRESILSMTKWAASAAAVILAAELLGAALLKILGPWELLIVAVVAGSKYLYENFAGVRRGVATVQEAVLTFADSFVASWQQRMPAALAAFSSAVRTNIIQPLEALAASVGITSLRDFGAWFGNILPVLIAGAVQKISEALNLLGVVVQAAVAWWNGLSAEARENIKAMAEWALSTGALILVAEAVAGAILSILGPWELLIVGVTTGIKYLWDNSATFRNSILVFAASFAASWKSNVVPALQAFWVAIRDNLAPALLNLAHAFGLPEFKTFQDFMSWFGTQLPVLLAMGIAKLTEAIGVASEWIQKFTDKWNSLDEATQRTIGHIAGFALLAAPFSGAIATMAGALSGLLLTNPGLVLLGGALVGVGFGIKYLWDHSQGFRDGINAFKESFVKSWGQEVPQAAQRLQDSFQNRLLPALDNFSRALGFESFKDFGTWLGEILPRLVAVGINALADAIRGISDIVSSGSSKVQDVKNWWNNDLKPFIEGFQRGFLDMWNNIEQAVGYVVGAFKQHLMPALQNLARALGYDNFRDFGRDLGGTLGTMVVIFATILGLMIDYTATAINMIATAVKVTQDTIDWIKRAWDATTSTLGAVAHWLKETWDWLAQGVKDAWDRVSESFGHVTSNIRAWWDDVKNWFHDRIEQIKGFFSSLSNHVSDVGTNIRETFKGVIRDVIGFINNFVIKNANWVFDLIPGFKYRIGEIPLPFARGGLVEGPGTSTSDSIRAMLSNGEFVVNARATADYLPLLRAINAGAAPNVAMARVPELQNATMGGDGSSLGNQPIEVVVMLDGEIIDRKIISGIGANNRMIVNASRAGRKS